MLHHHHCFVRCVNYYIRLKLEKELEHVGRIDLMDRLQKAQTEIEKKSNEVATLQTRVSMLYLLLIAYYSLLI